MLTPQAFVSCTFDSEFEEIINYFFSVIRSCGFTPILLKNIEAKPTATKIKDAIKTSDIFIALLLVPPSDYVLNEIGIAFSFDKPIILLKERSVSIGGIIRSITDYRQFELEHYWLVIPDLVNVLVRMHRDFMSRFSIKEYLIRKYVRSAITIDRKFIENTTEIEILNLSEQLNEINHGLVFYNKMEAETAEEIDFKFKVLYPELGFKINKDRTSTSLHFSVKFNTPLRQGQIVRYMYYQKLTNYLPMTLDDLRAPLESNVFYDELYCERNFTVSTPTEALDLTITLPLDYHILKAYVVPLYYKANVKLADEAKRISEKNLFIVDEFAGRIILRLKVPFPKIFSRYSIRWIPDE